MNKIIYTYMYLVASWSILTMPESVYINACRI